MPPSLTQTAKRWKDVTEAILKKEENPQRYRRFFIGSMECETPLSHYSTTSKILKNYRVGEPFQNVYFTQREAECMMLILRGYTNTQVAQLLNLSSRTVEFYLKNMRQKTGCISKTHLMSCIAKTNFLDSLDFTMEDLL